MQVKAKGHLIRLNKCEVASVDLQMRGWKAALHDYLVEKGHVKA
jgi:hypothetical protein